MTVKSIKKYHSDTDGDWLPEWDDGVDTITVTLPSNNKFVRYELIKDCWLGDCSVILLPAIGARNTIRFKIKWNYLSTGKANYTLKVFSDSVNAPSAPIAIKFGSNNWEQRARGAINSGNTVRITVDGPLAVALWAVVRRRSVKELYEDDNYLNKLITRAEGLVQSRDPVTITIAICVTIIAIAGLIFLGYVIKDALDKGKCVKANQSGSLLGGTYTVGLDITECRGKDVNEEIETDNDQETAYYDNDDSDSESKSSNSQGYALHIGINEIDEDVYGTDGRLNGCENDAINLSESISRNYKKEILLSREATKENVVGKIRKYSQILKRGDIFLLTYSGHGSQVKDVNGDEPDKKDETWCLFDGQLIDDELHGLLAHFKKGVRVVVLSDSCHSGTIIKPIVDSVNGVKSDFVEGVRFLPQSIAQNAFEKCNEYDKVKGINPKATILAAVKSLTGCQDNQFSYEEDGQGRFTKTLIEVWNNGNYKNNYYKFLKSIRTNMPDEQSPQFSEQGDKSNTVFNTQRPFKI